MRDANKSRRVVSAQTIPPLGARSLPRSALAMLVAVTFITPLSLAQSAKRFDITAQAAASALRLAAVQGDFEILIPPKLVEGKKTNTVKGELAALQALEKMLDGTGLAVRRVNGKSYVVEIAPTKKADANEGNGKADNKESNTNPIQLAQASSATGNTASASDNAPVNRSNTAEENKKPEVTKVEKIEVTGSRVSRIDADGPALVTIITRAEIERTGATSVADVLSYLPQQVSTTGLAAFAGQTRAQLRGLAVGNTLVLINGRRTVSSAANAGVNSFDLNSIPLPAVERVEILMDSASAIYGADAVAGVVNIILKKSITTPSVDLFYGLARGAAEQRISGAIGWNGEKIRTSLIVDAYDREQLSSDHIDVLQDLDYRRFGASDLRSLNTNPGNITSATAANLPGLTSRFAAIPVGSTGVGLTPQSFAATAGQRNLGNNLRFNSAVPESKRTSALSYTELDLPNSITATAMLAYSKRDNTTNRNPATLSSLVVPATNAFNPFGVAVVTNWRSTEPVRSPVTSESTRADFGLKGVLGKFDWDISVAGSHEKAENADQNTINLPLVTAALASSNPAQALNVFRDGSGGSPELLSFLFGGARADQFRSSDIQFGAFIRGDVYRLPAGDIGIVAGVEKRQEKILIDSSVYVNARRDVQSIYAETRIPLLSAGMNLPMVDRLAATLAVRNDRYSDFGSTTNPQYGIEWAPTKSLLFRGTYAESFLAPSLFQLQRPRRTTVGTINDPLRGNEQRSANLITGGNPDLQPETSKSTSIGAVWAPSGQAFRSEINFWEIKQAVRAVALQTATVLNNASLFPSRVIRATPTAADVAAGRPGALLSVDTSNLNAGQLQTRGFDLSVSDVVPSKYGQFSWRLAATRTLKYDAADLITLPTISRVGVANTAGTIAKWRATASLGWQSGAWGINAIGRYIAGYEDINGSLANIRYGRQIPNQTLMDLQANIDFSKLVESSSPLYGTTLRVGAQNLLDKQPEFSAVSGNAAYDISVVDPRMRFVYVKLTKSF
jgi:iron complex outermembrane recepter protein